MVFPVGSNHRHKFTVALDEQTLPCVSCGDIRPSKTQQKNTELVNVAKCRGRPPCLAGHSYRQ